MTSPELESLADALATPAPGLAAVLHNWSLVVDHDPLAVAKEALAALAGAQLLAAHVPDDEPHREAIEVLDHVFLAAARAVFARDARKKLMDDKLDRLADVAQLCTLYNDVSSIHTALETLGHHLKHEPGKDAATARRLVVIALDSIWGDEDLRALCHAIDAVLERPGLKNKMKRLRDVPTLDGMVLPIVEEKPAPPTCPRCGDGDTWTCAGCGALWRKKEIVDAG